MHIFRPISLSMNSVLEIYSFSGLSLPFIPKLYQKYQNQPSSYQVTYPTTSYILFFQFYFHTFLFIFIFCFLYFYSNIYKAKFFSL